VPRAAIAAACAIAITRVRHGKRPLKAGRLTRAHLLNGTNTIPFSGRIGKRALKPGAYKATLKARNAKGGAKPVTVRFSIVR
jgi:hypothetical protein